MRADRGFFWKFGSLGVLVDNLGRWFGGAELRWLGSYPPVADYSRRSPRLSSAALIIRWSRYRADAPARRAPARISA
jgi:hypothetical protein